MVVRVMTVDYTMREVGGDLVDSSQSNKPLVFLEGARGTLPGLEHALKNIDVGVPFSVTIPPEQAFGVRMPQLVDRVPKALLSSEKALYLGQVFTAQTAQGPIKAIIVDIDGDEVTIDANHPMAGKTFHIEGQITHSRPATKREIQFGVLDPSS